MIRGRARDRLLFALALLIVLAWSLLPYLWQVVTSFKSPGELATIPPVLPRQLDLDSYRSVLGRPEFGRILFNSVVVAFASTSICLICGGAAAFALVFLRVRGRALILGLFLSIAMLPQISTLGPLYLGITRLGLRDTLFSLIGTYTALGLPVTVWFLTGFLKGLPGELYGAARIDGCSPIRAFIHVVLPLARPGVATTAIFTFVLAWNELLYALAFSATHRSRTAPVEIALFAGIHEVPWGEIAAASILFSLPLVALVFVLQRRIVAGLLSGGVKG